MVCSKPGRNRFDTIKDPPSVLWTSRTSVTVSNWIICQSIWNVASGTVANWLKVGSERMNISDILFGKNIILLVDAASMVVL